ncbi:hypothetical protein Tco_1448784 [Tanacetum coccineum]
METQKPLLKDEEGEEVDVHMYRSMIGSLMYLTSSRPDIMFAVCQPKLGLWYLKDSPFDLVAYTDSDYTKGSLDRKSTTGGKAKKSVKLMMEKLFRMELKLMLLGKKIIITEASVRRNLQLEDEEDEAIYKELGDSLVRAATTASSLEPEQDIGNITKTRSKATPNETTSGGGPRCQETMGDTISQTRVLDLEKTKTTQANEIASLKRRVTKLKKKISSRTHKLKRVYKVGLSARVESSGNEEDLGEDASKQRRRINAIDADEDITLVNIQDDADNEMFDVNVLNGEDVFVAGQNENVVEDVVDVVQVSTAAITDNGKGIMIQEHVKPMKKKDLIRLDEEAALKLQAEFDEEKRLARDKAEKEKEANIALIEEWDDIQAKIDADYQLAERMQAQEQEELSDA